MTKLVPWSFEKFRITTSSLKNSMGVAKPPPGGLWGWLSQLETGHRIFQNRGGDSVFFQNLMY
jgi:hypothetical protein